MKPCRIVAVTGRSGSGKSTVSAHYAALGYPVLDGDKAARAVTEKGSPCLALLVRAFGKDILAPDGTLLRRELAARAFSDAKKTQQLTDITHPAIIRSLLNDIEAARQKGADIVFVDGAVIVGAAFEPYCDTIIVVTAPLKDAITRIVMRDGISKQAARDRLAAQMPEETLLKAANYVIRNDHTEAVLLRRADEVLHALLEKECNETV